MFISEILTLKTRLLLKARGLDTITIGVLETRYIEADDQVRSRRCALWPC